MKICVDTGGTFTDLIALTPDGSLLTHKLLSTPKNPAQAVIDGIQAILQTTQHTPSLVTHGSTVATNALLEDNTPATALITTQGFQDLLHIGRQNRSSLYSLQPQPTPAPIPRTHCFGVIERTLFDGSILTPLSKDSLHNVTSKLRDHNIKSVAICLLHSYANPLHERSILQHLQDHLPHLHITASHILLPEPREYERAATCVVNAVVAPHMRDYLTHLQNHLAPTPLHIMGSAGGTLPVHETLQNPIHTILSGPAGGVVGAIHVAQTLHTPKIITFDMGGTSTDVSLCDHTPTHTHEATVGPLPARIPMLDIHTVGAGGGSIARVDRGGALTVGPQSAGASPGPACYGRQTQPTPTVTDANLILGRLLPSNFLNGRMTLHAELAERALATLQDQTNLTLTEIAEGILSIAELTMARAIKKISLERGLDPRSFALLSFGGAGGLHACNVASLLRMDTVIIPKHPGLLSAFGMLHAPSLFTSSTNLMLTIPPNPPTSTPLTQHTALSQTAQALRKRAHQHLLQNEIPSSQHNHTVTLSCRYKGQSHDLEIDFQDDSIHRFHAKHQRLYGLSFQDRPIEIVSMRIRSSGHADHPPTLPTLPVRAPIDLTMFPTTPVTYQNQTSPWPVVPRDALSTAQTLHGPILITEPSSTTLIPPSWALTTHPQGHITACDKGEPS